MLIPLRVDVPMSRRPWVNYVLIALTVLISVGAFYDAEFAARWSGYDEAYPKVATAVTSAFLHAGYGHLIGNMLFLWIFGNAMNYKFGQLGYLGFYIFGAFVSGMAHYLLQGGVAVGASGAIFAVIGAFVVFFPRNDITVIWMISLVWRVSSLSSGWIILFWIAWDIAALALGLSGGVALWAHVGGFLVGFALAWFLAATGCVKPTEWEQTLLQVIRTRRRDS